MNRTSASYATRYETEWIVDRATGEPFVDMGNGAWDGAESFTDSNGNGAFDPGEPYRDTNGDGSWDHGEPFADLGNGTWDTGEPFTDRGNGIWDAGESFTDTNGNGSYDTDLLTVTHTGRSPQNLTGLVSGDQISARVRASAAARRSASNAYGTTWSTWSAFGPWSVWIQWTNSNGDLWTDTNGNRRYDSGEPFTDTNSNGIYDPPASCPLLPVSALPPVTLSNCPDPTDTPAYYPAGHAEPYVDANGNSSYDSGETFTDINRDGTWTADLGGHPTGVCYPPGHTCLTRIWRVVCVCAGQGGAAG
ncbi:MAG: hypothetical protein OXT70_12635, partial [Chloroflexota bacterium]|nr:hypothetical protein [Chloroflexota bacterium]